MPHLGMTSGTVGHAPCGKERKKRKRDVAVLEDKSDALFEGSGARERGAHRSAGGVGDSEALASTPLKIPTTVTRQEKLMDKNAAVLGWSSTRSGGTEGRGRKEKAFATARIRLDGMVLITVSHMRILFSFSLSWFLSVCRLCRVPQVKGTVTAVTVQLPL